MKSTVRSFYPSLLSITNQSQALIRRSSPAWLLALPACTWLAHLPTHAAPARPATNTAAHISVRNLEPKACNLALTGYQNSTSCQFASSTTAGPNGSGGRMITISSQGGLWILALKPDASIWYLVVRDLKNLMEFNPRPARFAVAPSIQGSCATTLQGPSLALQCTASIDGTESLQIRLQGREIAISAQDDGDDRDPQEAAMAGGSIPFMHMVNWNGQGIPSPEDYMKLNGGMTAVLRGAKDSPAPRRETDAFVEELLTCNQMAGTGIARPLFPSATYRQRTQASMPAKAKLECSLLLLHRRLQELPSETRLATIEAADTELQKSFSRADSGGDGAHLALLTRLNRQGLLQEIERNQALLARVGPHKPLLSQLTALKAQMANPMPAEQQEELRTKVDQLEKQIYQLLPVIKPEIIEPQQVARLLPKGAALVEFQRFRPFQETRGSLQPWGAPRYLALVLKPDGNIRAVSLGDANSIDALVTQAIQASSRKLADADSVLQAASVSILEPLRSELTDVRELFISPDGELNRLPFAALPMPDRSGRILSEALKLRLLTSGRDLVRLQQSVSSGGPAVLVANPEFTPGSVTPACAPNGIPPGRQPGQWQSLPCTAEEASRLAPLLQVPKPLLGAQASAANVLATHRPRILHIASHGFFWSEEQARAVASQQAKVCGTTAAGPTSLTTGSPALEALQRSGIVLAGANDPCRSAEQDGYLTAAEATGMDLQGTELTTLSACQTGLGDVRSGEGVYGLQRALTVAGSRSTLLTLWKVGDAATQEFMTEFYKRLRRGESRADALAATQATFRNHPNEDYRHVYYWGAFQLTGDWQPIAGW